MQMLENYLQVIVSLENQLKCYQAWEKQIDGNGREFYINHNTQMTTYVHPLTGNGIFVCISISRSGQSYQSKNFPIHYNCK